MSGGERVLRRYYAQRWVRQDDVIHDPSAVEQSGILAIPPKELVSGRQRAVRASKPPSDQPHQAVAVLSYSFCGNLGMVVDVDQGSFKVRNLDWRPWAWC